MNELKTKIVLRNDTSDNWEDHSDKTLLKGEVGIEFTDSGKAKVKIGDGTSTWADLGYFGGEEAKVFQAVPTEGETDIQAITRVVDGAELHVGDQAIVKRVISGTATENIKYSYTAYVYAEVMVDDTPTLQWTAMDGNYSAANVYFDANIALAGGYTEVGNIKKSSQTLQAAGKSVKEIFEQMLSQDQQPAIITQSSVTCTLGGASSAYKEIGSVVSGTMTVTGGYNAGQYTQWSGGPATQVATGVVASNYSHSYTVYTGGTIGGTASTITDEAGQSTSAAYNFIMGKENRTLSCSVKADLSAGVNALTYLGNAANPEVKMPAKTNASSGNKTVTYTYYIPAYYGFKYAGSTITPEAITDAQIKALGSIVKDSSASSKTKPTSYTATGSWMQLFVAIPTAWGYSGTPTAKDSNNLTLTVVKKAATVDLTFGTGDNKTLTEAYDVYYIDNAAAYDTKAITFTW